MNLRVPKQKVEVQLCDEQGRIHRGDIFLSQNEASGTSSQRVQDLLRERKFVPVRQNEKVWFIQSQRISWVKIPLLSAAAELDRHVETSVEARVNDVKVELVDGSTIRGKLRFLLPDSERRLGDYIERYEGFMPVRTEDDLYLVNVTKVIRFIPEVESGAE